MFTAVTKQPNLILPAENAAKLKQLFLGIGELLASSGMELSSNEFYSLSNLVTDTNDLEVEASCLTDQINTVNWFNKVDQALSIFQKQFRLVFRKSLSEFQKEHGVADRSAIAQDMVKDITDILRQYIQDYPGQSVDGMREKYQKEPYMYPPIFASRQEQEEDITNDIIEDTRQGPHYKDKNITILGTASVANIVKSHVEASANQTPCSGVLFLVDEPSEAAPSKGSNYPLYVSREVAQRCVEAIANQPGLPLDIDDSLVQHSKSNITGVITSAEIQGNKFIVHGHLFPWSQESKVAMIAANRRDLGMSMNAHATGSPGIVNGQKVFRIDHLELLGANILKASHATYQKTKFWANEVAAAASTTSLPDIPPFSPKGESSTVNIEEQLEKMSATLDTIVQAAHRDSERVDSLEQKIDTKLKVLEELEASRRKEIEAARQREVEASKQQEKKELLESMATLIAENNKGLLKALNPSGSPRRLAPLIQASSDNDEDALPPLNNIERRLLDVRGRLIEARANKEPGYIRARLIEEEKALEAQMQQVAVI